MKDYKIEDPVQNICEEPTAYYALDDKYDKITSVLGGTARVGERIHGELDMIKITRRGLPKSVLEPVSELLSVTMEQMSQLIHVSHRTLQRKSSTDLLSVYSSEQVLEIAEVISQGIEVLGSIEAFSKWMHSEVRHLDYQKPVSYLDTSFGTQIIKDTLGRIAHGVYA